MSTTGKSLEARGVDLSSIRNRNEHRVAAVLNSALGDAHCHPDPLDIQDMYALALNLLPARYIQKGTIVLREKVTGKDIEEAVRQAIEAVSQQPKY